MAKQEKEQLDMSIFDGVQPVGARTAKGNLVNDVAFLHNKRELLVSGRKIASEEEADQQAILAAQSFLSVVLTDKAGEKVKHAAIVKLVAIMLQTKQVKRFQALMQHPAMPEVTKQAVITWVNKVIGSEYHFEVRFNTEKKFKVKFSRDFQKVTDIFEPSQRDVLAEWFKGDMFNFKKPRASKEHKVYNMLDEVGKVLERAKKMGDMTQEQLKEKKFDDAIVDPSRLALMRMLADPNRRIADDVYSQIQALLTTGA